LSLEPAEWDFSGLPAEERIACRDYEYGREIVIRDDNLSDWSDLNADLQGVYRSRGFDKPPLLKRLVSRARSALGLSDATFGITSEQKDILRFLVGWDVLVVFPEWPKTPYLKIDHGERMQRLKALKQSTNPLTDQQLVRLISPDSSLEGRKIELLIPDLFTYGECEKAFRALLREHFPEKRRYGTARSPAQSRRKKAPTEDVIADLNALSVCRLAARGHVRPSEIIGRIRNPEDAIRLNKSEFVYGSEKALEKPQNRGHERVFTFRNDAIYRLGAFLVTLPIWKEYFRRRSQL
jgi:hypothetical protein